MPHLKKIHFGIFPVLFMLIKKETRQSILSLVNFKLSSSWLGYKKVMANQKSVWAGLPLASNKGVYLCAWREIQQSAHEDYVTKESFVSQRHSLTFKKESTGRV